ncbi:MAG: VirB4 family type IV secretion system protein, partial [bacterium]
MSQREYRLSFFVEGLSQERAAGLVQKKRAAALGAVTFGEGRATQASEEQAAQYDTLLRSHARKELRFVRWSAYLSVFADDVEELGRAASELAGVFNVLVPDEGILRQVSYWQSTLPFGRDWGGNPLMAQSDAVSALYPFFEFRSTSPEGGVLLGFGPANQPCFFDPWSKTVSNGNVFVTGQAGSGKSYLINLIVNRLGIRAFDVSFIDRAKSYRSTCLALGGDYVEFSLDGVHAVNVWDVLEHNPDFEETGLNDLDAEGRVLPDKVEQVAGCVEIVLAENGAELPKLEKSLLLDDIADTYRRCLRFEGRAKGRHLLPESVPRFSDLAETLSQKIGDGHLDFGRERRELLQKLQPAVQGYLAGLLNRPTTLAAGARARVFDISNLPDQPTVLGAAVYVLAGWLYRHWRRNKALN